MAKMVKAVKTGDNQWDIVGSSTGNFYGTLNAADLVDKLIYGGNPLPPPPVIELSINDHLKHIESRVQTLIAATAKTVHKEWVANKTCNDVDLFKQKVIHSINYFMPNVMVRMIASHIYQEDGATEWVIQQVFSELKKGGLDPANPVIPKTREEQISCNVPPVDVDEDAISMLEHVLGETDSELGDNILTRAIEYLTNINEVLDILRLEHPGQSTHDQDTISEAVKSTTTIEEPEEPEQGWLIMPLGKAVTALSEDIDF